MESVEVRYGKAFDWWMSLPLLGYLAIVAGLVASVFLLITPAAVHEAFRESAVLEAIQLSLITSVVSTLLSVLVAVPAGYVLARNRFPGRMFLDTLLDLPIVLPPLVLGLALLIFFNTPLGRFLDRLAPGGLFVFQPLGIVLAQFTVGCAFAVRVIKAGFDAMDARYEEVAMALGANRSQTFLKVVLPHMLPSVMAGAVVSWARIFGLFGPILLLCGTMRHRTEIMPTTIFLEVSIGRIEVALVVSALMILMSVAALLLLKRLGAKEIAW